MNHCVGEGTDFCNQDLDVLKRDRFELLSAYLDGEVTPEERRLVRQWLEEDPGTQCLYERLLQLRTGFHSLYPASWASENADRTAEAVVSCLDNRLRLTCMAGVVAVVVGLVGTLSGSIGFRPVGSFSQAPVPHEAPLEIALDQPVIAIPESEE